MSALIPYAFALAGVLALASLAYSIRRAVNLARAIIQELQQ